MPAKNLRWEEEIDSILLHDAPARHVDVSGMYQSFHSLQQVDHQHPFPPLSPNQPVNLGGQRMFENSIIL